MHTKPQGGGEVQNVEAAARQLITDRRSRVGRLIAFSTQRLLEQCGEGHEKARTLEGLGSTKPYTPVDKLLARKCIT